MQDMAYMDLTNEDIMRGKYLTFQVQDGEYGIEISYVTEIIGVQDITSVPHTHRYVKGIINLRGTIVPVIDMRLRFGLEAVPYSDRTCIIVLSMDDVNVGMIVEAVQAVSGIDTENIQPPPKVSGGSRNEFIKSIGLDGEDIKQLLDVGKVFEMAGEAEAEI